MPLWSKARTRRHLRGLLETEIAEFVVECAQSRIPLGGQFHWEIYSNNPRSVVAEGEGWGTSVCEEIARAVCERKLVDFEVVA